MKNEESNYKVQEPGFPVFFISITLGAVISYFISTHLLGLSPLWISVLIGAIFSIIGVILGENIVEAIILCFVFGLLVFLILNVAPDIEIIRISIAPVATGFCIGKIVHGIWKELN